MADETLPRDENRVVVIGGTSSLDEESVLKIYVNPESDGAGTHGVVVKIA